MLQRETACLRTGRLVIELGPDLAYRLAWNDVVEYRNGRRRVGSRWTAYEFRSVEQLRYDFERDVREAGGSLG